MTQDEALVHASDRAAHKVARRALRRRQLQESPDAWPSERAEAQDKLNDALDEYEEAERRAQKEATA